MTCRMAAGSVTGPALHGTSAYRWFCLLVASAVALIAPRSAAERETDSQPPLPHLAAEALDGSPVVLPDSALGSVTLLGFGFSRDSREVLDRWLEPWMGMTGPRTGLRSYQVPMMGGGKARAFRGLINRAMRKGLPPERHSSVLPYYGDIDAYALQLGMSDHSQVYVFLLDPLGHIRWQAAGEPTAERQAALADAARQLWLQFSTPVAPQDSGDAH